MLVTLRLRFMPGLSVASSVPVTVFLWCFTLAPLLHGPEALAGTVDAAGPFAAVVALALLIELPLLSLALAGTGLGRRVPLAVMLGMATLPWMVGLLGTEVLVGRAMSGLTRLSTQATVLDVATSTGHAMAPRLLGAWTSAALLLGLALGLALARFGPSCAEEAGGRRRGRGLLLASGVTAALGSVAVVGALEARHFLEMLTGLGQVPESAREEWVATGMEVATRLREVRWLCTSVLAVLGIMLVVRGSGREASRLTPRWAPRLVPAAAVTALLVMDVHPVQSVAENAHITLPRNRGAVPTTLDMLRLLGLDVAPAQSSQMSNRTPATTPTPNTTSMMTPSEPRASGGVTSSG
ncbi:hypothetical protein FJV41_07830 [Myxococcus llanfairpwllgwyngyllgogerychwyrndrobwllllantysiliogogogochensis]|uniref:Uncharacterized protein n=1 Tax=Myxococcus llanfairpwllgwyngyllgogerychwyrndrobwllllantysiliogogogochensis TaxID=2590453 RepID=A0A540X5J4_9BACT|nr:hypothetical protein [Myxococcus llanfairpwllgwyngyllgogerychwyrndrobwllllantysiliogogogochensis]TQF16499.1 hypothetical protein FJV41_07830 [Myxococcus llanfairpwllgwyngyllgogerychwyrndrobwllllantysiliogogogochensis]